MKECDKAKYINEDFMRVKAPKEPVINQTPTEEAYNLKTRARIERNLCRKKGLSLKEKERVEKWEKEAEEKLKLKDTPVIGTGGELIPNNDSPEYLWLKDTVQDPNTTALYASIQRQCLAKSADVSELALDLAETIQANNSIEKIFAHEVAISYSLGMKSAAKANEYLEFKVFSRDMDQYKDTVQLTAATKLMNASNRSMETGLKIFQTLERMKGKGQQTITVVHQHLHQHVHIEGEEGSMRKKGDTVHKGVKKKNDV